MAERQTNQLGFADQRLGPTRTRINSPRSVLLLPDINLKSQIAFNKEKAVEDLYLSLPHLWFIPRGQRPEISFNSGGTGKIKLLAPAFVKFARNPDGNHMIWYLMFPAEVQHPKHKTSWIHGLKDVFDPSAQAVVKQFTNPEIGFNRKAVMRRAEKQDIDKLSEAWHVVPRWKIA